MFADSFMGRATRSRALRALLPATLSLSVLLAFATVADAAGIPTKQSGPKPTVVLVHGAWDDASGWNGVIKRLQGDGYTVLAPANPLRGLAAHLDSPPDPGGHPAARGHRAARGRLTRPRPQPPQADALC